MKPSGDGDRKSVTNKTIDSLVYVDILQPRCPKDGVLSQSHKQGTDSGGRPSGAYIVTIRSPRVESLPDCTYHLLSLPCFFFTCSLVEPIYSSTPWLHHVRMFVTSRQIIYRPHVQLPLIESLPVLAHPFLASSFLSFHHLEHIMLN
jgi:hypothetical protein